MMKRNFTALLIFALIITLTAAITINAQIPERISFQGKLLSLNGQPFNGTKNMTFTVGSFTKQMSVPVINGLYSVILDVPDSIFKGLPPVLNIKVDGTDLSPDTEFSSVPYSYLSRYSNNAGNLGGRDASYYLQTLSIDSNKISISNGNTVELPAGSGGSVVQDLSFSNDTLKITNNSSATPVVLDKYVQDLVLNNDTLKITKNSNPTHIDLKPYLQTLALNSGRLSISGGNSVDMSMVEQDPKVGTLTTNYLPKWGTDRLENSFIYSDNGRIGIGVTTMSARLHTEVSLPIKAFAAYNNYSTGGGGELGVTLGTNPDPALRAFTQGMGYAADFAINNISNSSTVLNVTTTGTGPAGKFFANTPLAALDVTNNNANGGSQGIKVFSPVTGIYSQTNSGRGVEGIATAGGTGVYGFSANSFGGLFQSGNTMSYALKSDGNFYVTMNTRIDGNTGMGGNPDAAYRLYVYGNAYATGFWMNSDVNLKNSIQTLNSPLDKVLQLRGVEYNWNDEKTFGNGKQIGFIAQELQQVFPELVKTDGKYLAVQYAPLTAVLVEAMKEMNTKNTELKNEV